MKGMKGQNELAQFLARTLSKMHLRLPQVPGVEKAVITACI